MDIFPAAFTGQDIENGGEKLPVVQMIRKGPLYHMAGGDGPMKVAHFRVMYEPNVRHFAYGATKLAVRIGVAIDDDTGSFSTILEYLEVARIASISKTFMRKVEIPDIRFKGRYNPMSTGTKKVQVKSKSLMNIVNEVYPGEEWENLRKAYWPIEDEEVPNILRRENIAGLANILGAGLYAAGFAAGRAI